MLRELFSSLNIFEQCKKYGLPIWQLPQFLFLVMGVVIIVTTITTYTIGNRYIEDPLIVTLVVLLLATILFVFSFIITKSFEKLAEVSRMKTEFISVVSHQMRSPLTNLKWVIDLLISGGLGRVGEKQVEYLKILKEDSKRMTDLIKDLLIVSRIELGALFLKKEKISLEEMIKEVISEFKTFAEALNVGIKFQAQENLPKVFIDIPQIKLVIEKLLDNAVRYNKPRGSVEIGLEKKGKKLYFGIRDTGVGIPKEDQRYIFQKFFRSSNVLRHQTQGSGLGLYLSKSIIEKSGGKIRFKSREGVGSTFWFTLPTK